MFVFVLFVCFSNVVVVIQVAFNRARASKKEGFRHLELVLLRTPWHVSSSFRDAVSTGAPLNLTGLSDPSDRGLMWDLTKVWSCAFVLIAHPCGQVPVRAAEGSAMADTVAQHKSRGKRKRRFRSKLGVTVAGSDLRRLNHDESRQVLEVRGLVLVVLFGFKLFDLQAFGVQNIPSNRWTRIELITEHSVRLCASAEALADADPELAKVRACKSKEKK